jgi:hypothetical protein
VIAINRRVLEQSIIPIHRGMSVESILTEGSQDSLRGDVRILKILVLHIQFLNTARNIKKQAI